MDATQTNNGAFALAEAKPTPKKPRRSFKEMQCAQETEDM